jgi:glycosyltransferase involved in cell wall biosynthesis
VSDATREVVLVAMGDDPVLGRRLRDAAWLGVAPTVFARPGDERAERLATAAGAELGSVFPDVSARTVLVERPPDAEGLARLDGHTVVAGIDAPWPAACRVIRLEDAATAPADVTGVALREWDGRVLEGLGMRGWRMGPASPAVGRTAPPRLDGLRALHVTSVHRPDDGRILHREVAALRAAGADARVLGLDPRPARTRRLSAGWRLVAEARRRDVDVVHIHDPELLPAVWMQLRSARTRVVYDAHEYLGQTTRTKPWIPERLRVPTAVAVERLERLFAGRVDAVVGVTEDMALDFAEAGIRAVSVANFAPRSRFPETAPATEPLVVYVGALDRSRGLDLMLEAFPMVDAPGARLLLAGPGDPGPLPPGVEHVGPLGYDAVPAVLARAAVVWIPLRRTPNNDRGRLTKVMEAMASGRPLVASDLTRTAAIVRQAGCGIVVPFDDPAAHARAIGDLLRDTGRARRMGAAGRAVFLDRMTFESEAAKLVALYATLTGRDTPAAR